MRKIISSTYMSLDGVINNPQHWHTFADEEIQYAYDLLFSCGALLMGRETYESFAASWPHMEKETGDFGVRMNTLPHYVVSDSLEKADWGDTIVIKRDDAVAEIAKLKEQDGQDILQYGFGPVSRTLVEHGLLDELRLWINPVLVGTGAPAEDLITKEGFTTKFDLADTAIHASGVIIATYRPLTADADGEDA